MAARSGKQPRNVLSKKVPVNPKYVHVKSSIDTGWSASKYAQRIEEIRKNYRYRKDEIFKRMKVSTFCQLVLQVAEVINVEADREFLSTADTTISELAKDQDLSQNQDNQHESNDNRSCGSPPESTRSTLQSVIRGMGEVDLRETAPEPNVPRLNLESNDPQPPDYQSLPFLLLDVRDQDAFKECHIIGAINYPSSMLSRSVNYFTKEILEFKNRVGKIIILYDEEERIATSAATVFVQRDVDNVFLLSGGMKVLNKKFPDCFLTGKVPLTCLPSPTTSRKTKVKQTSKNTTQDHSTGCIHQLKWFTPQLLQKMEDTLDIVLLSKDTSRMSSRSTAMSSAASNATNRSSQSTRSSVSTKPWK